jgi:ABC-type branched-subunit amino acid transport system substrate-binding protein
MKRRKVTAVFGSVLIVIAAACGSSKPSATTPSSIGSSSPTAGGGKAATGSPVNVMAMYAESEAANLTEPALRAGDAAAVAQINADGGLGGSGHPIHLTFCNVGLAQSGADTCTHQAATDSSIVAVVGSITGLDISTVLDTAGIPEVDALPLNATGWIKPNSFPNNSGALVVGAAAALAVNDLHATRISLLYLGLAQVEAAIPAVNNVLASWKAAPLVHTVPIPVGASDVSSQVTTAAEGSDVVIYAGTPSQDQQVTTAFHTLGITVPLIQSNILWTTESLKSNAGILEGSNVFDFYPTNDVSLPGNTKYLQAMNAAGAQQYASNSQAKSGWIAFDMLNTACKGLTSFSRASIMAALNQLSNYDAGGLIPDISFTSPGPIPTFPRLHNLDYFWAKIHDGQVVAGPVGKLQPIYGS